MHHLWFGYFWPSLLGNGPEAIVQTVVYGGIAVILIPAARKWVKRETTALHAKLDHAHALMEQLIKHQPDTPPFGEPK